MADTLFWLEHHAISDFAGLVFDDGKYARLAEQVDPERVVAVLDDYHEMYDAAAEIFGDDVPILINGKYNRDVMRPTMMSMKSAVRDCLNRVNSWMSAAHA